MKRSVVIVVVIFLFILADALAVDVDPKVEEGMEKGDDVSVIVVLKDDPQMNTDFSIQSLSKEERLEKRIKKRKLMVRKQQNKVLSRLDLEETKRRGRRRKGLQANSVDGDFKLKGKFSVINGFSGKVTKGGFDKLKNDPNVAKIYFDGVKSIGLSTSVPQINADDVWPLVPVGDNLTGLNQTICVIDSGVDYTHVNLGNCSEANFTNGTCSKVVSGWDYDLGDNNPMDDNGHGTHVSGIIVSNDTTLKGVAPDAKIVALKACNSSGSCGDSELVQSIDWCIANRSKFNITVITMSLGGGCYTSTCDGQDAVVDAANNATGFGLFVDASTGNNNAGQNCVASPACGSNVTAVGGVQDGPFLRTALYLFFRGSAV